MGCGSRLAGGAPLLDVWISDKEICISLPFHNKIVVQLETANPDKVARAITWYADGLAMLAGRLKRSVKRR